jgi:outer membrane lipoprotein-sorting protein
MEGQSPAESTGGEMSVGGETRTGGETPTGQTPGEGAGSQTQEIDVGGLLSAAEQAYVSLTSLRASFLQVMEVPLLERSSRGTGVWYQKGRDRFRMDFEDPPDDEIVADGTYLWIYHPSQTPRQVIRTELASEGTDSGTADLLARILSEARTSYSSSYDGRESVDGVDAHVVTLTPLGRSPYSLVRVWIAPGDQLVRKFQIVEVNESIRTVTLSNLEPNAALSDSLFRFTVPPGADVFSG